MGKFIDDLILDAPETEIDGADEMVCCDTEPTTYLEAHTTYMLATVTMADSDFTKADGDVDGRKVTVSAKNNVPVVNEGTPVYVALTDTINSRLLVKTPCTGPAFTASQKVYFPPWKITFRDPT